MKRSLGFLLIVLLSVSFAAGQAIDYTSLQQAIDQKIDEIEEKTIQWRRHFHQYPELSNQEFETAKVIEKHFIMDRTIGGPDASFSMEPKEFSEMVKQIRQVEKSLGKVNYQLNEKTKRSREFARSLFVAKDMKKGDECNVRALWFRF